MSFDWSNRPREFSGVDPEAVFNSPRFAGAVMESLKNAPTLRDRFAPRSIDPRAIDGGGLVTSLPSRAYDGQVVRLLVNEDAGWVWTFAYHEGHPGDHKWFFLGGSSFTDLVAANESTTSTSYADLATTGPSVTVPLAGVYAVGLGCTCLNTDGTAPRLNLMSPRVGSATPTDADSVRAHCLVVASPLTALQSTPAREFSNYFTTTEPNQAISAQYRVNGGTGFFFNRYLTVTPVRVRAF